MIISQNTSLDLIVNQPMMLDILLHVATLAAVVLYFRRQIGDAVLGAFRLFKASLKGKAAFTQQKEIDNGANIALCVVVGTLPTGILGVLMSDLAGTISATPTYLGLTFVSCAGILFASRFFQGGDRRLTVPMALIIGLAQGIAVLPGLSRSGTTIAVALALGVNREEAATFSFLLSLPAILGAAALEIDVDSLLLNGQTGAFLIGALAAFLVGLMALVFLVALVRKGRLWLFAPYLLTVGILTLSFI